MMPPLQDAGCRAPFLVFCFCSLIRLADCGLACFLPLPRGFCAIVVRGAWALVRC